MAGPGSAGQQQRRPRTDPPPQRHPEAPPPPRQGDQQWTLRSNFSAATGPPQQNQSAGLQVRVDFMFIKRGVKILRSKKIKNKEYSAVQLANLHILFSAVFQN